MVFFGAKKALAKGLSPPQELKVGPRSGQYLLVNINAVDVILGPPSYGITGRIAHEFGSCDLIYRISSEIAHEQESE